jgi:inner membrane protein
VVLGLVGTLPDLDLLLGIHGRYTHSVGAALIVGALGWLVAGRNPRWGLAFAAAYASHVLFDWLGQDTTPPIGVMALWPFSGQFYQSGHQVFVAISRRYWLPGFASHNLQAVIWELVLLGLPTWAVWRWRYGNGKGHGQGDG